MSNPIGSDPKFNMMASLSKSPNLDPDGTPNLKTIQSMSQGDVEQVFNKSTHEQQSIFLAKVAVAAQSEGFDGAYGQCQGRKLIVKAVELYAKHINVDFLNLKKDDRQNVVMDFMFNLSRKQYVEPDAMKELMHQSIDAFNFLEMFIPFSQHP